jgi:hypothetical protein
MRQILTFAMCVACLVESVDAGELERTLGLNRRVGFTATGPELAPFSYGRPMNTIAVPDALMFPLMAANEGLTFYAAYRARNYRAMAAVGAMSLWGGTLRSGIDAVAGGGGADEASVEDLVNLTEREIDILGYLWHTDGKTGGEIYLDVPGPGTWQDLREVMKRMEKRHLIRRTRSGSRDIYAATATPLDARRAALASGSPDRISAVLQAIKASETSNIPEVERESESVGHRAQTQ